MKIVKFNDGIAIQGVFGSDEVYREIGLHAPYSLIATDPPYGNIVNESWDNFKSATDMANWMIEWSGQLARFASVGSALYVWGGTGKPGFRPFYQYLVRLENESPWNLSNHITWRKRRGYGTKTNYLYTREELAYFVLGNPKCPKQFKVPLLDKRRGYAGYNKKYPAKSEFYRRTNVWDDITEIMRGKVHPTQKPIRLYEIPIEIHTAPGDYVLDPFSGSGVCAQAARNLDRKWIIVEADATIFEECVARLSV